MMKKNTICAKSVSQEEVDTVLLGQFCEFLCDKWHGSFRHSYSISNHRSWLEWRTQGLSDASRRWYCSNLRDACARYSWGKNPHDIALSLQEAVAATDCNAALDAAYRIFCWGGVAKYRSGKSQDPSRQWVQDQAAAGTLTLEIERALDLLKKADADLEPFDGKALLMNSAMTKVYWAADSTGELVMYDGRVGAALGLLAREFLTLAGMKEVPNELKFRWGASRDRHVPGQLNKRNPSAKSYVFPALFGGSNKDKKHADMVRKTSFLLKKVAIKLGDIKINCLEKALFMVGYDVRGGAQ